MVPTVIAADIAMGIAGGRQQFSEVNARIIAHAVEHIDQVLAGGISGGPRRKGTAAQTAQRRLHSGDTALDGGQGVGDAHVPGVVDMYAEGHIGVLLQQSGHLLPNLGRVGHANGVAQVDTADTHVVSLLNRGPNLIQLHLAHKGTAEHRGQIQGDLGLRTGVQNLFQVLKGLLGVRFTLALLWASLTEITTVSSRSPAVMAF